jgi:signal transduction histidine kinase
VTADAAPVAAATAWRRHGVLLCCAAAALALWLLARTLAALPGWPVQLGAQDGALVVQGGEAAGQAGWPGAPLRALQAPGAPPVAADAALLHRSPRWQPDAGQRASLAAQRAVVLQAAQAGSLVLHRSDGATLTLAAQPLGLAGLGALFWPLAVLGLALAVLGAVVVLARPRPGAALYALMAAAQAATLLLTAAQALPGMAAVALAAAWDTPLRLALDSVTGLAALHLVWRASGRRGAALPALGWAVGVALWLLLAAGPWQPGWWLQQALVLGLGGLTTAVLHHTLRTRPDAWLRAMRRLSVLALATLALASAAVAVATGSPALSHGVALGASVAWSLFLASLLLLAPFAAGQHPLLREFALLAGLGSVAVSLALLAAALFSLGSTPALTAAAFAALLLYALGRQPLLQQLLGAQPPTAERSFALLLDAARAVQAQPGALGAQAQRLLAGLFEPLEWRPARRVPPASQVVQAGAGLLVPLQLGQGEPGAVLLLHARRGQRLFGPADAQLADGLVAQLQRSGEIDRAVERGRHEERLRIAQDLHDDIGARLLTLMYQAPTPELEDYIRHTLQDLKTLTRGLAAAEHRLSHAAAEWKADLGQRLGVAQGTLRWSCQHDVDATLSVVEWSALTRILRELATNALFHGHATTVEVSLQLLRGQLTLTVTDDGEGRNPGAWQHGLGLGGVRKRAKALGGVVRWTEAAGRGIRCEVQVPLGGCAGPEPERPAPP